MAKPKHTIKEQRFIDFYDGNGTDAARKAGYKNPERSAKQNVRKRTILLAIANREKKRNKKHIASREERQEFWTEVLSGEMADPAITGYDNDGNAVVIDVPPKMSDRLKASEHLARSEADFTDTQKHVGADGKDLKWAVEIVKSNQTMED